MSTMTMSQAMVAGTITRFLADQRRVNCLVSNETQGRDGHILVTAGIDTRAFRKNPVVLLGHDANRPIARCAELAATGSELKAVVQFPDPGVSPDADQALALVRAGLLSGISTGFRPLETRPLSNGGMRIMRSELLEFSIVSIPAVPDALVERAFREVGNRATPAGRRALAEWKKALLWLRAWEEEQRDRDARLVRARKATAAALERRQWGWVRP